MIKYLLIITTAFAVGYFVRQETTFYAINCDTTKYTHHWKWFNAETGPPHFNCLGTNIDIQEEVRLNMKYQLILNKLTLYKLKNTIYGLVKSLEHD